MSKQNSLERRKNLRIHAEAMIKDLPATDKAMLTEVLAHELLVHKVELEMQNEELRRAQLIIEDARDQYKDLYEFAPVGYITLDAGGLIHGINLIGALQLGKDRAKLINKRFSSFVDDLDKDRWHRIFVMSMKSETSYDKQPKFRLRIKRDQSTFETILCCLLKRSSNSPPLLRIAMMDIATDDQ